MSLWGNSDNVTSVGTVTLDYSTGTVTSAVGAANSTRFGDVGAAKTGDVIRFGLRGGGTGVYFGDAVITGITSHRVCTIGSTAGLSGAAIAATSFYVSELPKYTVLDHAWSNKHDTVPTYKTIDTSAALTSTGVGVTNIAIKYKDMEPRLAVGGPGHDSLLINGTNVLVAGLGTGTATATATSGVGSDRIYVTTASLPNISANSAEVQVAVGGVSSKVTITDIQATYVAIGSTISAQVAAGSRVLFHSPHLVSFASTLPTAITSGDVLSFQRLSGGYDRQIYGISTSMGTGQYAATDQGWVGVTTYTDCDGNFRVKSETFVAMSGISTGANSILYPTNKA